LAEVQNQLLIAKDVDYIKTDVFDKIQAQLIVAQKLLNGLIKRTKTLSNQ